MPSPGLQLLHARYAESLPAKSRALAQAWQSFVALPEENPRRRLRELVHRLCGSAQSYGYASLGELAGAIDRQIADWESTNGASRESANELIEWISRPMQELFDALEQATAGFAEQPSDS